MKIRSIALPLLISFCLSTSATMTLAAEPAPAANAGASTEAKQAGSASDPVARIGETSITRGELERTLNVLVAQNRIPEGDTPEARKESEKAALEQLIFAELIFNEGMKTPPADLDKLIEAKMSTNKGKFASPEDFETALKNSNVTEKELEEITKKDIVITNFIEQKIVPDIAVSDEEIKNFYESNKDQLKEEEQVRASHILFGVDPSASAEEKKKAKDKAEALLKEIRAGKDFAEAAKANSTCPSKDQGGDLGYFGRGQMVQPFEQAAFGMKVGEISGVVETQFGYHIIKLTDKKEGATPKLEELKDKIEAYIKGQKTQKAVFDYVTKLRKDAKVEILL